MYDKPNDSSSTTYDYNSRRFVLVVDDDPQTRQDHAEDLRDWGYEPIVAEGKGKKLIEDAKAKARQHRCRVAIVDMRLFGAEGDESGLMLAGELAPTVCIIVTAYGSIPATNRSRRYNNIVGFFEKGDDPNKLMHEVYNAFEKFCSCDIELVGPGYRELLRRAERETYTDASSALYAEDEIRCALNRLYQADDKEVRIKQLFLNLPGNPYQSQTSRAIFTRSAVYEAEAIRADGYHLQREIVKVAEKARIEREVQNYRKYVRDFLPPERSARAEDAGHQVTLWNIGAIRYTNIARDDRQLFCTWYASASVEELKRALDDLFHETLGPLYRERLLDSDIGEAGNQSVYDYYTVYMLPLDFEGRIQDHCSQGSDKFDSAPLLRKPLMLRDPVKWAHEHRSQSAFCSRFDALTHGDLHSGNIFVDADCKTYVMGFEQSGPGHALRDFVRLEVEILLGFTRLEKHEFERLFQLAISLYRPRDPEEGVLPTDLVIDHPETRKAFSVVSHLHKIAYELIQHQDQREYLWAVLLESLGWLLGSHPLVQIHHSSTTRDRALILASVVCERLADWDHAEWPSGEWGKLEWMGSSKLRARDKRVQSLLGRLRILHAQLQGASSTALDRAANDAEIRQTIEQIRRELSTYGELPERMQEVEAHSVKESASFSELRR